MTDVHEPPPKKPRGRPRKDAAPPGTVLEKSEPATVGKKRPRVVVKLPDVVEIQATSFERLLPALMDSVARVKNSGRLSTMVHTPTPDTGKSLAAEMGKSADVCMIASGVPLEPFEIALLNLATCCVVMVATFAALPKDMTYEQGMMAGQLTGKVLRGEVVIENGVPRPTHLHPVPAQA